MDENYENSTQIAGQAKTPIERTNNMNELQIIDQREVLGKDFKIYGDAENPLFLARDVAEWIEHSNPSKMISDAELSENEAVKKTIGTLTNSYSALFLTEDGLYEVLMQSRKPIARQFKQAVKEILRSIRKHGAYLTPDKIEEVLLNPDTIIRIATDLKAEREKRAIAEAEKAKLEEKVEADKPKVVFADAVAVSKTSILVGEMAKILKQNGIDIGQNRLFEVLRDKGYLIKRQGTDYNMPTQRSMELGLFEIKETAITHSDGHVSISKTPKVTGRGQQYFINLFLSNPEWRAAA